MYKERLMKWEITTAERFDMIPFEESDYLKSISISSTTQEKEEFIKKWLKKAWENYWNPKFLAKENKILWISLEDIFTLQARKRISDIHLSRWDLILMKISWDELRVWLEFLWDEKFDDDFWRKKLTFDEIKELCFDFLDLKTKQKLLNEWSVDMNYRMMIDWKLTTFRLSVYLNNWAISLVARYINPSIWILEELIEAWLPKQVEWIVSQGSGLVLVAWPMASWKSYTLASILDNINKTQNKHITTIEDPIEVIFKPKLCTISQKEVWKDTTSFQKWSKSCLRQDTQVVLLWELRNREEMEAAIDLATNWNLVFATTHSASVEDCIRYIYDAVPKERKDTIMQAFSTVLRWILVQRMIQKPTIVIEDELNEKTWEMERVERSVIKYNIAYELLVNNERLMKWLKLQDNWTIDFRKIKHNIEDEWVAYWNISLNKSLIWLLEKWDIEIQDALDVTYDKIWLKELINTNEALMIKIWDLNDYL